MSLANDFELYKREIDLIAKQNPYECELYSIIASVMREREHSKEVSIRDVSKDQRSQELQNENLYSENGVPDFVILNLEYKAGQIIDKSNPKNYGILGAIEIKNFNEPIDNPEQDRIKNIEQLKEHIKYFKKVIYTNGLVWQFYESENNAEDKGLKWTWQVSLKNNKQGNKLNINQEIEWASVEIWNMLLKKLDETIEIMINAKP